MNAPVSQRIKRKRVSAQTNKANKRRRVRRRRSIAFRAALGPLSASVRATRTANASAIEQSFAPTAVSSLMRTAAPQFTHSANSVVIRHRELIIGSIPGSINFQVPYAITINPGLATTFPWLSSVADRYQYYRTRYCRLVYIPIAPTSAAGDVIISPVYNVTLPVPLTESVMVAAVGTVEDSCWKTIEVDMDTEAMNFGPGPRKVVRATAMAGDARVFDAAVVYVGTNNETNTSAIGKLFIDYAFEFYDPIASDITTLLAPSRTSVFTLNGIAVTASGVPAVLNLSSAIYDPLIVNSFGVGYPTPTITPPAGAYYVRVWYAFSSTASFTNMQLNLFTGTAVVNATNDNVAPAGVNLECCEGLMLFNGTQTLGMNAFASTTGGANWTSSPAFVQYGNTCSGFLTITLA